MMSLVFEVMIVKVVDELLSSIRELLYSYTFKVTARKKPESFTRKSKMNLPETTICILKNSKTGIQTGVYDFLEELGREGETYTKQAFSKRRQEIKAEAILSLVQETAKTFYQKAPLKTYHGYHVMAIDGTRLNLPCTDTLRKAFGEQTSQGAPQVQMLCSTVYDVLNDFAVDMYLGKCKDSERNQATALLQRFHVVDPEHTIILMDRGYPSAALLNLLDQLHFKYLLRYSEEFLVNPAITGPDCLIEHRFSKSKIAMTLRTISVNIGNTTEHLVTNLFASEWDVEMFRELYHKRWGVETGYNLLKNVLEIENFSGITETAVMQDCYATAFLYNLASAIALDYREEIESKHKKPENKYEYKLSLKAVIRELRRNVVEMILADSPLVSQNILNRIKFRLQNAVVPVRPGRTFERKRKHTAAKFHQNTK